MDGLDTTGASLVNCHFSDPPESTAFIWPSGLPVYTVPLESIDGENDAEAPKLSSLDPKVSDHFCFPLLGFNANRKPVA